MEQNIKDRSAYRKVLETFRRQQRGATVADIVARTALPLQTVRELVPQAADEYSARLEVTESGEILYSFPRGFVSKYRGFKARLGRFLEKSGGALKIAAQALFKVWIMVMLVGYFVLFMVIALGALMLSVAASSSNSSSNRSSRGNGGGIGGMYLASSVFNMIIRIWFYSELTSNRRFASMDSRWNGAPDKRPKGRPLYRAIFSFVFGDGDPNADWDSREKQAVIACLQANSGVISLPEFMTLTGRDSAEAEERIVSYCAEFGGMPEATEDGTVAYRFDELLLRADKRDRSFSGFSAPLKRLRSFSSNPKKMNVWFGIINSVNLLFGGYFFINTLNTGHILTQAHFEASSYLYGVVYVVFSRLVANPLSFISLGLGIIPLVFSFLFWIIPALRYSGMKKHNETAKLENLRKDAYGRIWDKPLSVRPADINPAAEECRPKNMAEARERALKEIGAYSVPDVAIGPDGEAIYSFKELEREKAAVQKYRASVKPGASDLGETVFDST
jgi:hypothetical protein